MLIKLLDGSIVLSSKDTPGTVYLEVHNENYTKLTLTVDNMISIRDYLDGAIKEFQSDVSVGVKSDIKEVNKTS